MADITSEMTTAASAIERMQMSLSALGRSTGLNKMGKAARNLGGSFKAVGKETVALVSNIEDLAARFNRLGDSGKGLAGLARDTAQVGDCAAAATVRVRVASDALAQIRDRARQLGQEFSEMGTTAAGKLIDSLQSLSDIGKSLGLDIGDRLLPPFTALIERAGALPGKIRDVIATNFDKWLGGVDFQGIADGIDSALGKCRQLANFMDDVANAAKQCQELFRSVSDVLKGEFFQSIVRATKKVVSFGMSILSQACSALVSLGSRLLQATASVFRFSAALIGSACKAFITLGAAIMATPVGWFMAATAAIAGAAYLIYKNWEPISAFFKDLWGGVIGWFGAAADGIADMFDRVCESWEPLKEFFADLLGGVVDVFASAIGWIGGLWDDVVGWFADKLGWFINLLPDGLKSFLGLGGGAASIGAAASSLAEGSLTGGALGMAADARGVTSYSEKRSTEQVEVVIHSEDGTPISVRRPGGGKSNVNFNQGQLAMGVS